ncbi:MAG TPA: hypothetical protein VIE44_02400 [Methylomirabilota bacterium]|jgi:hypothetical protein
MSNRVRSVVSGLVAIAALSGLTACSSTHLTDVWRDPAYSGGPFHEVAVFVLGTDDAVRRLVEDEVVRRLPMSTRGIGSYGIVPDADRGDIGKARERLRAGGFDGVLIARLVGVEGPVPWSTGSLQQVPISYRTLENYYVSSTQEAERASALRTPTVVRVQMNVYVVPSEALVWSASSRTFNPEATRDVAGDVAKLAVEDLQRAGILAAE